MMPFSSRHPFTTDPLPWQAYDLTGRDFPHRVADEDGIAASSQRLRMGYRFAPRPGYAVRAQSNPPNEVLMAMRLVPPTSRISWAEGFLAEADRVWFPSWSPDEVEHARRVVTRWLAVHTNALAAAATAAASWAAGTAPVAATNEGATS